MCPAFAAHLGKILWSHNHTLYDYRKVIDDLFITFIDSVNAAEIINERGAKDSVIKASIEKIRLQVNSLTTQLEYILAHRGNKTGDSTQTPDITNPTSNSSEQKIKALKALRALRALRAIKPIKPIKPLKKTFKD